MKQPSQGPLVVVLMFAAAFVMGGYAWWYQRNSNPQCRAFWGTENLLAIEQGAHVELLQFASTDEQIALVEVAQGVVADSVAAGRDTVAPSLEPLEVEGGTLRVAQATDLRRAPGLVHARHALVVDANFQRSSVADACGAQWDFGLRFSHQDRRVTIIFDRECDQLWWVEGRRGLVMVPKLADAFRKKRTDWSRDS